jgi:hypothetical protein
MLALPEITKDGESCETKTALDLARNGQNST